MDVRRHYSTPKDIQQIVTIRSTSINETLICPGRDYLIFEETHSCMSHHQAGRQAIRDEGRRLQGDVLKKG